MARLERSIRQAGGWAALAIIALVSPNGALADPGRYTAGPPSGRLTVQVRKRGLLSGLAHDHDFLATAWRAGVTLDPAEGGRARVEVVVEVASLEDQQPALSAEDRGKVNRQAAQTLDAARFPELRFTADQAVRLPPAGALDLAGTLTLHGQARPLTLPLQLTAEGEGWRVRGAVKFKQSDFGVSPFSGFLGTIAVHDEVEVALDLLLTPAR